MITSGTFVEGISKLKLVFAHSIMVPLEEYQASKPLDLAAAERVPHGTDLDHLIDITTTTDIPIVDPGR